jgi:hypothetical protein
MLRDEPSRPAAFMTDERKDRPTICDNKLIQPSYILPMNGLNFFVIDPVEAVIT